MKSFFLTVICLVSIAVLAEKPSFDRYQTIIDRQMFGPLPEGFDPTKSPDEVQSTSAASEKELTKEQEKLQSAIHFSVLNVDAGGATVVGFTDNSNPKVPKHYYLKVGEKSDGWEVKAADPEAATMTVVKDEIEVTLKLGGNSAQDASATAKAGGAAAPAAGTPAAPARRGLLGNASLRARRMQRHQEENAAKARDAAETAAREAARQEQAEQDRAQREAERAEQRQQLLAIQEELKRVREAKSSEEKKDGDADAQDNAQ